METQTEKQPIPKEEARRRGLRIAAKLAAAGVIAAACAASAGAAMADEKGAKATSAEQVKDLVTVRAQSGGCGCAPCWGPPAPPAMPNAEVRADV
ncbi:MAG: hypothetical protein U0414_30655 [Polyangiaceae bacterium]